MNKGFDANQNCAAHAASIVAAGYTFVCRYINQNKSEPLTKAEVAALCGAGLSLVSIWESGRPTSAAYFTRARGLADGKAASRTARALGQPTGSPIYFAVDFDATQGEIASVISAYFAGVEEAFVACGSLYDIGVYGSGAVCDTLIENTTYVGWTWLSQATGWLGSKDYANWNIKQHESTTLFGINVDLDITLGNGGGWSV